MPAVAPVGADTGAATEADSDGDSFDDLTEINFGRNPNDAGDAPSTWQVGLKGYWPLDKASFEASDPDPANRFFPDASGQGYNGTWDGTTTTPAWFTGKFAPSVARLNAPTAVGADQRILMVASARR